MSKKRDHGLNIRVTLAEREAFNQACASNDKTPSRVLRKAMKKYIEKSK